MKDDQVRLGQKFILTIKMFMEPDGMTALCVMQKHLVKCARLNDE